MNMYSMGSLGLASIISIFSLGITASTTPQFCLHDASIITINRACLKSATSDLIFQIGRDSPPIQVDLQDVNESPFHPWSHGPLCTPVLEDINSKLCVYTNSTFAGGRGISIFTTPKVAQAFAALLPFQDPGSLDGVNGHTEAWYTKQLPGKGIGMLAKQNLKRGTLITAYTPLFLAYMEQSLSTKGRETFWRAAVDQLPAQSRDAYFSLTTIFGDPNFITQDVLKANTFEIEIGGKMHLALFPETSRMNHDCGPNSQYRINPSTLTHYVYAARSIALDEEITITYTNPFQTHSERQSHLLSSFHFTCQCSRCKHPTVSDAALSEITSLQAILGDWSAASVATIKVAEKLIKIYKQQGLDGFLDSAYGYATLTYNAAGDAKKAKKYAKLAAEAVELKDGTGAKDWPLWQTMMKDPKSNWSWRNRRKGQ